MEKKSFIANRNDKLANLLSGEGFSYNYASKLIRNKDVKVDGVRVKENIDVMVGSEVTVFFAENSIIEKFEVIFEDDNVLIIDKKAGIEVEGAEGLEGKIVGALAVHRLDRNTEGLLVMAKNVMARDELLEAFKNHNVEKRYIAEVVGKSSFKGELKKAYLVKDKTTSFVKIYNNYVKGAVEIATEFITLKSNPTSSIVECKLITGKTHQIRAHLAYLGYPIIGDGKYGKNEDNKKFKQKWQKLYCYYLKFGKFENNLKYLSQKKFTKYPSWYSKN